MEKKRDAGGRAKKYGDLARRGWLGRTRGVCSRPAVLLWTSPPDIRLRSCMLCRRSRAYRPSRQQHVRRCRKPVERCVADESSRLSAAMSPYRVHLSVGSHTTAAAAAALSGYLSSLLFYMTEYQDTLRPSISDIEQRPHVTAPHPVIMLTKPARHVHALDPIRMCN